MILYFIYSLVSLVASILQGGCWGGYFVEKSLFRLLFHLFHEHFSWLESWNFVFWDDDSGIL